jgi:hypothetical protein
VTTAIYIVLFARGSWWVDLDGRSHGPYETCEQATEEAVARATETSHCGGRSEVRVSGPGHNNDLVYQSATRSLLSRTVALAHP